MHGTVVIPDCLNIIFLIKNAKYDKLLFQFRSQSNIRGIGSDRSMPDLTPQEISLCDVS